MPENDDINISDVIEVIETTDPDFSPNNPSNMRSMTNSGGNPISGSHSNSSRRNVYVEIVEQPASKAMRFRYECEGRSAGSIPGSNSTSENKTFPTIRVCNYKGKAVVVVSCVTKDAPYRPHPHNLVGKEGCRRGVCTVEIPVDTMTVTFSNLGIRCVKKKDIEEALKIREEIRVDPYRTGFAHRSQPSSIDLNAVRLCFQVFLEGETGKFTYPVPPVVSEPIFDKKAMSDLAIFQLSDDSSSVAGGRKILLFCEKVTKEDIQVRFFEEHDGQVKWEGFADFQPADVHRQVGIAFRTPRYHTLEVTEPVKVNIQLLRPSDKACSEPLPFLLTPLEKGRPAFWSLRRSLAKKNDHSTFNQMFGQILAANNNQNIPDNNKSDNYVIVEPETQNQVQIGDEWKTLEQIEAEQSQWDATFASPNNEPNNNNPEEKSLSDLLNQVAELDEIYSDSQARILNEIEPLEKSPARITPAHPTMDVDPDPEDSNTYSSLQMAFKNPVDLMDKFDEVITAHGPLIEITSQKRENCDSEKLPPLPPKRAKKTDSVTVLPIIGRPLSQNICASSHSIALSTEQAQSILGSSNSSLVRKPVSRSASFNVVRTRPTEFSAPQKHLPPTPTNADTLPNPKKRGFFSKLFRRNSKDKTVPRPKTTSNLNSPNRGSVASFKSLRDGNGVANISLSGGHMQSKASKNTPDVIHISLKGPINELETYNKPEENLETNGNGYSDDKITEENNLDLTEAEHYALYTAIAPHATQSEFDETSCYYAPVEGGKVL